MGRVVCSCPKSNDWMCVAHTKVGPPIVGAPGAALGIYKQNWVDNLSCSCHAEGDPCSGEEHQRVIQGDKILKSRNEPFQGWCVRRSNWTSGNWRGGGAGAGMGPSGGMGGGIGGGVIRGGGGGGMGPILRGGYTPGGPVGPPTYQPPGPPPSPWQYFGHNPMAGNQPPAELPVLPPGAYYVGLPPASQAPNIPAYPPGTPGMRAPYPWETAPTPEGYWSFDWVKFAECFAAAVYPRTDVTPEDVLKYWDCANCLLAIKNAIPTEGWGVVPNIPDCVNCGRAWGEDILRCLATSYVYVTS